MSQFTEILEGSTVARPFLRLARTGSAEIHSWLRHCKLCTPFGWYQPATSPPADLPQVQSLLLVGGVGLLLLLLAFFDTGPIGGYTWLLAVGTFLSYLVFRRKPLDRITVIDLLVGTFVLSALVSTAFSSYLHTSIVGMAKLLTFLAGYYVFRSLGQTGDRPLYFLLGFLVLIACGEALVGFYQYMNHIQPLATWEDPSVNPELKMTRIFGTLKPANPNLLAGFLIPAVAAGIGLTLTALVKHSWKWAFLFAPMTVIVLAALAMTGSRGGYLSIGAMSLSIFAISGHLLWHDATLRHHAKLKLLWLFLLVAGVGLVGTAVVVSPSFQHRLASIFAMREDSSNSYRMNVYGSALRMFADNPVVGIGPGNGTFKLVYGLYMVPGYNALGAYSVPLEIAVEQGIIGLFIFLLLLKTLSLRAYLALDAATGSLERKILIGTLFTAVLGMFVFGFFDTIWYRPAVNLLFWLYVAALAIQTEKVLFPQPIDKALHEARNA